MAPFAMAYHEILSLCFGVPFFGVSSSKLKCRTCFSQSNSKYAITDHLITKGQLLGSDTCSEAVVSTWTDWVDYG